MEIKLLVEKLEEIRKEKGWSQTDLAYHLGISGNYLYRMRTGSRLPGLEFLATVKHVFPKLKPLVEQYEATRVNHTHD